MSVAGTMGTVATPDPPTVPNSDPVPPGCTADGPAAESAGGDVGVDVGPAGVGDGSSSPRSRSKVVYVGTAGFPQAPDVDEPAAAEAVEAAAALALVVDTSSVGE